MIAARDDGLRLPRVTWRRAARRSLRALLDFLELNAFGDAVARERQIEQAIESLRYSPLRCQVVEVKEGLTFRRLIVDGRFFVYYVYIPPRGMASGGTLSIRSIKHAGSHDPFLGVREVTLGDQSFGGLSTRDSPEPAATA